MIKRKISGDSLSADGRVARDVMLGLSFFTYRGDRLGLNGARPRIPPRSNLIIETA